MTLNRSYRKNYELGELAFQKALEFTNGHSFFSLPESLVMDEWKEVLQDSLGEIGEVVHPHEENRDSSFSDYAMRSVENLYGLVLKGSRAESLSLKIDNIGERLDTIFTGMEKSYFPETVERYFQNFFEDLGINSDGSIPDDFDSELTIGRVINDFDQNIKAALRTAKKDHIPESKAILDIFRVESHGISAKIDLTEILLRDIEKSIYKSFASAVTQTQGRQFFDFSSLMKDLQKKLDDTQKDDVNPNIKSDIFAIICSRQKHRLRLSRGGTQEESSEEGKDNQLLEPMYAQYLLVGQKSLDRAFSKVFCFEQSEGQLCIKNRVWPIFQKSNDHLRIFISSFVKKQVQILVDEALLHLSDHVKHMSEKVQAFRDKIPKILHEAFEKLKIYLQNHFSKALSDLKYEFVRGKKLWSKRALYQFFSDLIRKLYNTLNRKAPKPVEKEVQKSVQSKLSHVQEKLKEMLEELPANEHASHVLDNMMLMRVENDIDLMMETTMHQFKRPPTFKPLQLEIGKGCTIVPLNKRTFPTQWNRLKTEDTIDRFSENIDKINLRIRAHGLRLDYGVKRENSTIWRAIACQFKNVKDAAEQERENLISRGEDFLRCVVARQLLSFVATPQRNKIKEAFGHSPEIIAEKLISEDKDYWPGEPLLFFFMNAFTYSLALNIWVADCANGPLLQYNSIDSTAWSKDAINIMLVAVKKASDVSAPRHSFAGVIKAHHPSPNGGEAGSRKREADPCESSPMKGHRTSSSEQSIHSRISPINGETRALSQTLFELSWIETFEASGTGSVLVAGCPESKISVYIFDKHALASIYVTSRVSIHRPDGSWYNPDLAHVLSSLQRDSTAKGFAKLVPVLPHVVFEELRELASPLIVLDSQRTKQMQAKGILTQIANLGSKSGTIFSQQSIIHHRQVTLSVPKGSSSYVSFAILECALNIKAHFKGQVEVTVVSDDEAMKYQYAQHKYRPREGPHFLLKTTSELKHTWLESF